MTKKDLIKVLKDLPNNAQIIIKDSDTGWFLPAKRMAVEKKARIKKLILDGCGYTFVVQHDRLLDKARTVYEDEDLHKYDAED